MSALVDQVVEFATESTVNTTLCILAGTLLVYFLFFFEKTKKSNKAVSKSREISKAPISDNKKQQKIPQQSAPKEFPPVKTQVQPFLALYESTQAKSLSDAAKYVEANFKKNEEHDSLFEELLAAAPVAVGTAAFTRQVVTQKESSISAQDTMSKLQVTENTDDLAKSPKDEEQDRKPLIKSTPIASEPFLAQFEATTASIALEARKYIASLPKPPKPFLASYEATVASQLMAGQAFVASLPKPPKPFLATYEATAALTALNAKKYIDSLPKPPKPFLASYEATTAQSLQASATYIASLPKVTKPFLADHEATVASTLLMSREYVAHLVKPDSAYAKSVQSIKKTTKPVESLARYEATTATTTCVAKEYIQSLVNSPSYVKPASINDDLEQKKAVKEKEDIIEYEEELSSTSSVSEASTSSLSSEVCAQHVSINNETGDNKISTVDQDEARQSQRFGLSWDEIYSGDNNKRSIKAVAPSPAVVDESPKPWVSSTLCIYYPNCTNKNCKFIHPGSDNNPRPKLKRSATTATEPKRIWTRHERIERQSQTHFPIWKSRCVHWPFCTNNHCKYSHPIKECRMGDQCTFMERCMFLHPSDLLEPTRKNRNNNNNNNNDQDNTQAQPQMKRSNTTSN